MLLSRRLFLPALGALALLVSGSAVWKAQAQGGVRVAVLSLTPGTVNSGGSSTLAVRVTGTGVDASAAVSARLDPGPGGNPPATGYVGLRSIGNNRWRGVLTAPANNTGKTVALKVRVNVQPAQGNPVNVLTSRALRVRKGATDPGDMPPPPPDI